MCVDSRQACIAGGSPPRQVTLPLPRMVLLILVAGGGAESI